MWVVPLLVQLRASSRVMVRFRVTAEVSAS